MNDFKDERIDKIIKFKIKKDNYISDQANAVFENFKHSEIRNKTENINQNTCDTEKNKVIQISFYQKLNRVLSVAAVSLTVVLIGGTALYFNGNQQNNLPGSTSESIVYNQKYLVKNEPVKISTEQVIKESENGYIKAYLVGKRDVGINLTTTYWNEFDGEFKSTDCYKVDNINKNVSDILVGEIGGYGLPYLFLLMEDGTIEYVDLNCMNNYTFYFVATKLEGLNNVVGLEQKSRKYSYTDTDYKYVNAIRKDGLRKEIEIGVINNWNDDLIEHFENINNKYIDVHGNSAVPDDGKGDYTVDNITYLQVNGEDKYAYFMKDNKFYRVERSNAKEECLAEGVGGYMRDNSDDKISVSLQDGYTIYETDKNIIYNEPGVYRYGRQISLRTYDGIVAEIRENGNLILMFEIGELEKLGINKNETKIRENVRYNIYGIGEEVYSSKLNATIADAKAFGLGGVAPNNTLSLVYAKRNDTIVCIDLIDAIKFSDLHRTRMVLKGSNNIAEIMEDIVYEEVDGEKIEKYRTMFTIENWNNGNYDYREINYND